MPVWRSMWKKKHSEHSSPINVHWSSPSWSKHNNALDKIVSVSFLWFLRFDISPKPALKPPPCSSDPGSEIWGDFLKMWHLGAFYPLKTLKILYWNAFLPYTGHIAFKFFACGAIQYSVEVILPCVERKIPKFSPAALYSAFWRGKGAPQARFFFAFLGF